MRSQGSGKWSLAGIAFMALMPVVDADHSRAGQTGTAGAVPVLVELFTAEGCSSCPPADVLLEKMIEAQPASGAQSNDTYTPQLVVDGGAAFVGTDIAAARAAIEHAITVRHGTVRLSLDPSAGGKGKVAVSIEVSGLVALDRDDPADLIVAVTEDRLRTDVKHGENEGRTLTHAAVVRD